MKPLSMQNNISSDPTKIYAQRLVTMMLDYSISLREAVQWDFDGFMPLQTKMVLTGEEEYDYYLHMNYVPQSDRKFFVDLAFSKIPNYGLTYDKPQAK